jgi:rhodanese-related sulfurtransferase
MEGLDQQTVWMTGILVALYFGTKFIVPRIVASGAAFVDVTEVQKRIESGEEIVLLDVRTPGEFSGGHPASAVNVPLAELTGRLIANAEEMDGLRAAPIFVVCRTANRSPSAARILKKKGFANISVVKGGVNAWKRAKLPMEGASK